MLALKVKCWSLCLSGASFKICSVWYGILIPHPSRWNSGFWIISWLLVAMLKVEFMVRLYISPSHPFYWFFFLVCPMCRCCLPNFCIFTKDIISNYLYIFLCVHLGKWVQDLPTLHLELVSLLLSFWKDHLSFNFIFTLIIVKQDLSPIPVYLFIYLFFWASQERRNFARSSSNGSSNLLTGFASSSLASPRSWGRCQCLCPWVRTRAGQPGTEHFALSPSRWERCSSQYQFKRQEYLFLCGQACTYLIVVSTQIKLTLK